MFLGLWLASSTGLSSSAEPGHCPPLPLRDPAIDNAQFSLASAHGQKAPITTFDFSPGNNHCLLCVYLCPRDAATSTNDTHPT